MSTRVPAITPRPGYTLFPVDDRWIVRRPDGELTAIRQDVMGDARTIEDLRAPAHRHVVDALTAAGILTGAIAEAGGEFRTAEVTVIGPEPVTRPLVELLTADGHRARRIPAASVDLEADPDALCWIGPLPAAAARRLDARCLAGEIIWQRCDLEGDVAIVEPLGAGPAPVTHTMVRARRLAVAEHPNVLRASWSPRTLTGATRISANAGMMLAALLAQDILVFLAAATSGLGPPGPDDPRRRVRTVNLASLSVRDHPVLPIPECVWRDHDDH